MSTVDEIGSPATSSTSSPASEVHYCQGCGKPMIAAPTFKCACCGEVIRLRCVTFRSGGSFVAECIDLDITAEGATEKAAISGLQDAMQGYLSVVFDGQDKADTRGLIPRPSPWSHRVRYQLESAKDIVRAIFTDHRRHTAEKFYSVPSGC
jgi:hypothetical protein